MQWEYCLPLPPHLQGPRDIHTLASPFSLPSPPIVFSPEVWAALEAGRPVVALESTIITHGMPYPTCILFSFYNCSFTITLEYVFIILLFGSHDRTCSILSPSPHFVHSFIY